MANRRSLCGFPLMRDHYLTLTSCCAFVGEKEKKMAGKIYTDVRYRQLVLIPRYTCKGIKERLSLIIVLLRLPSLKEKEKEKEKKNW